jgi:hypothetical protein
MKYVTIKSAVYNDPIMFQQKNSKNGFLGFSGVNEPQTSKTTRSSIGIVPDLSMISPDYNMTKKDPYAMLLSVEACNIDLGRIELNELKECYLTLINRSEDLECEYEIYSHHSVFIYLF